MYAGPQSRQPDSNGVASSSAAAAVDWDAPLAAFTPQHPTDPTPPSPTPFSELGGLSGIPKPAETASASAAAPVAPQQVKAQSAVEAAAAQRVAALAKPALRLTDNALAAGRRGGCIKTEV